MHATRNLEGKAEWGLQSYPLSGNRIGLGNNEKKENPSSEAVDFIMMASEAALCPALAACVIVHIQTASSMRPLCNHIHSLYTVLRFHY